MFSVHGISDEGSLAEAEVIEGRRHRGKSRRKRRMLTVDMWSCVSELGCRCCSK